MFKNFDIKHYLALAACAAFVGIFYVIPSAKPFEPIALTIAAPLFLYAGINLPQAGLVGGKVADAAKKALVILMLGALISQTTACISSAPVVPVTPANQAQVSTCQSDASLHNGIVIGDFVLGGIGAGVGSAGALVSDPNVKTGLLVAGAVSGGLLAVGTAIAAFTASNFGNSKCSDVVGPLPLGKAAPAK